MSTWRIGAMVMSRVVCVMCYFFFSSRRRHTRLQGDWSSDVCSSDLGGGNRRNETRLEAAAGDVEQQVVRSLVQEHRQPNVAGLVDVAGAGLAVHIEIGRASCRERV